MRAVVQEDPAVGRGVVGLFSLAAAFTAVWLGLNVMFPELRATGIPSVVIRSVIHTTILAGLWVGLSRSNLQSGTRIEVWFAVALPFTAWLAAIWWLALDGAFRP